jgi:hypothetical protein
VVVEAPVESETASGTARPAWQRLVAVALGIYLVSRVAQLALIAWMAPSAGPGVRRRLLAWDAGWFINVAQHGYPHGYSYDDSGNLTGNALAFFPGYPTAVRLVHEATRLDYPWSALAVSWLAGAAAAIVVCALGARLYDLRVGAILAVLFCTQPMSVVLSMGYSEGLFVAFAAGTLLAAHRRAWLTAGGLALAAGLTRPTGVALAAALAVAVFVEVRRGASGQWRPIVAAIVGLAAVPAYLIWVGLRVGSPSAYFDIQTAGWGSTFDFGRTTGTFVLTAIRRGDGWIQVSVALILIAAVVATAVALGQRVWGPLSVYGLIALVLVVGQGGYFHSKPRLLVPVLLILVPVAVALRRARPRTAIMVLLAWAGFGLWYGAYLITVWHYAI